MDPLTILVPWLAVHAPWAAPLISAYALLAPIVVHAGGWDKTTWGAVVLSTSFDLIGIAKAKATAEAKTAAAVRVADSAPMFPPPTGKP